MAGEPRAWDREKGDDPMPMSFRARKLYHYLGYMLPAAVVALGVAFPLISLIKEDEIQISLVTGLFFIGFGAVVAWRHSRRDSTTPIPVLSDYEPAEQARQTRNLMVVFAALAVIVGGLMAYQLAQLEFGSADRVMVWSPIAAAYEFLGFWPAILLVPVLGCVILLALAWKLRAIKAGQTGKI